MAGKGQDIASVIRRQIEDFGRDLTMVDVGTVVEVGDGVARIHGLSGISYSELLEFEGGVTGLALNLEEDGVGAVILGDPRTVKEGSEVRSTDRIVEVAVGEKLIGRVVDALGQPIDGKGATGTTETMPAEIVAPDVASRKSVDSPVQTGIKAIDGMIPIGRGQRELVIGDRSTGKSMIAIDTIINQRGGDLVCVYVAIGQKASKVAQTLGMLGAAEFARMKEGAIYLNTARAGLHDLDALTAALSSGHLRAAGLDHFEGERLPREHPLLAFDNVVLTPHIGGATFDTDENHTRMIADDLLRLLSGARPHFIANPEVLD